MIKRIIFSITIILLVSQSSVFAQSQFDHVYRFLEVPSSAVAAALGGYHVGAFSSNSSMFSLNPAYLQESNSNTIHASFVNYLLDARYGYANYSHHVPSIGTLGFGIRYAGYGDLVLKRGLTLSTVMWDWLTSVQEGNWDEQRRDGSLTLYNQGGDGQFRFDFFRAWPTNYHLNDLNVQGSGYEIETVELAVEGLKRIKLN